MKEKTAKKGAIPFADKLAWSSCDGMGTLLAWNIFASYLTYYFTDVCGLAVGLVFPVIIGKAASLTPYLNWLFFPTRAFPQMKNGRTAGSGKA